MTFDATARRRWFGAVMLLAALGMLICGETVLKERLGPISALSYWLVCLVLTGLAIVAAFLDVRALRRRIRQEQRALFESTLKKIQAEAEDKRSQSDRPQRGRA